MNISDYFNLPKGHENFDFVDVSLSGDTRLFIDPCLVETTNNSFCKRSNMIINDYFDGFYGLYRNKSTYAEKYAMFNHAHEINATKLGYGSGYNGKAKTADGMISTFEPLQKMFDSGLPLSKAIDLEIFIRDFAEDCLSDMLTNILFLQLSEYTLEQCKKYSAKVETVRKTYHYWDLSSHSWKEYSGKGLYIESKFILLVPKSIVRHSFYYDVDQFFRSVILQKMKEDQTTYDDKGKAYAPRKKDLRESLLKTHSDVLEVSIEETTKNPFFLEEHHSKLPSSYRNKGISNEELDRWAYKKSK